jgi:hypothetical protein
MIPQWRTKILTSMRAPMYVLQGTPCLRASVVGVHFSAIGTLTPLCFANSFASS